MLNSRLKRGEKLQSRALLGQLIGYNLTNIYRLWMPTLQRVVQTQDAVFALSNSKTEEDYPD